MLSSLLHPIARWYVAALALVTTCLVSFYVLAAQPVDAALETELAEQLLAAGLIGTGAGMIVRGAAWLISQVRQGVPTRAQPRPFADSALPGVPFAPSTAVRALAEGTSWQMALVIGVNVLLIANVPAASSDVDKSERPSGLGSALGVVWFRGRRGERRRR